MRKSTFNINENFLHLTGYVLYLPFSFDKLGGTIHETRNVVKVQTVDGLKLVIKSYQKIYLANRLIYRFFRKTKGERALTYANYLLEKGINTPKPIAYINSYKNGLFQEGYFICEYTDFISLNYFKENNIGIPFQLLEDLVHFIVKLHENGIFHGDFTLGNILFKMEKNWYSFSLIDNNRINIGSISPNKGLKNLKKLDLQAEEMAYLVKSYARIRGISQEKALKVFFDMKYSEMDFWKKKKYIKGLGKSILLGLRNILNGPCPKY
jgi:tRNA A-37 threonylcarbamoyl transferase component Bud32